MVKETRAYTKRKGTTETGFLEMKSYPELMMKNPRLVSKGEGMLR